MSNPDGKGGDNSSNTKLSATATTDFWGELQQTLDLILTSPFIHSSQESVVPADFHEAETTVPEIDPHHPSKRTLQLLGPPPFHLGKRLSKIPQPQVEPGLFMLSTNKQDFCPSMGTQSQHKLITDYLKRLRELVHTQVTIEAKIFEVLLNDHFKIGIDWSLLGKHLGLHFKGGVLEDRGSIVLGINPTHFSSCLSWMERFGTVRTLSNPRITVLKNQPALIKVVKNEVFFRLEMDRVLSADHKPDLETTTSHMQTVPIDLLKKI